MITTEPAVGAATEEALLDGIVDVLGRFLRATEVLNRAIDSGNAIAMCDALESLRAAREQAFRLVSR